MSPIHASKLALVLIFSTVRLSPQFHGTFDSSFTTINVHDGNIVPPRYWQAMCEVIKGNKTAFMSSEKHDTSSTFISLSYQGCAASYNAPEPD